MNQNQPTTTTPEKSNKKLVITIVAIVLGLFFVVGGILAVTVMIGTNGAKDKAKDAQIKSNIQSLHNSVEIYFNTYKTYKGWTGDPTISSSIQESGSNVVIQGLTDKTYVIYAKLPSSQKLFCVDSKGFSGEITSLTTDKTACQ